MHNWLSRIEIGWHPEAMYVGFFSNPHAMERMQYRWWLRVGPFEVRQWA